MNVRMVVDEISTLPPEKQEEVADFVAFLHFRSAEVTHTGTQPASEGFVGMWADREDMRESNAWLRRLRKREWMSADG